MRRTDFTASLIEIIDMVGKAGSRDQISYCLVIIEIRVHNDAFVYRAKDHIGFFRLFRRYMRWWEQIVVYSAACGSNRRHSGISIFSIPKGKDDLSTKTRDEWVRILPEIERSIKICGVK